MALMKLAFTNAGRRLAKDALLAILPRRMLIASGRRQSRSLCLTFDDGPDPEVTPRVLDALGEASVRATFFVIGQRARRFPRLIERISREGHALGNHTYYHRTPRRTTARRLLHEVHKTAALLRGYGPRVTLFRPPWGSLTPHKLGRLWQAKQTVVLWSYDPRDCRRPNADELRACFRERSPRGGDIVLLHDTQVQTAQALPLLLADLGRQNFSFETLDAWLAPTTKNEC